PLDLAKGYALVSISVRKIDELLARSIRICIEQVLGQADIHLQSFDSQNGRAHRKGFPFLIGVLPNVFIVIHIIQLSPFQQEPSFRQGSLIDQAVLEMEPAQYQMWDTAVILI